jgi:hypothetical protein
MGIKSPKDIRDGFLRRLLKRNTRHSVISSGFLSVLSEALYNLFGATSRSEKLIAYLKASKEPKVFIIDEFISARTLDVKALKNLGAVLYLSQDIAYTRYGFADNVVAEKLMYKLESDVVREASSVICCSERDRLKYLEMGAKKVIVYPNIYPMPSFQPIAKDQTPSLTLVLKAYWGPVAIKSLNQIMAALSHLEVDQVKLNLVGLNPQFVPKNIQLQYCAYIPSKQEFLKTLSQSWIGINVGVHRGGTNERKYEYALSGLVVFSDYFGVRGDLLPYEYTYLDSDDLAAKLKQIIELGPKKIADMGNENRKQALLLAEKYQALIKEELAQFKRFFSFSSCL